MQICRISTWRSSPIPVLAFLASVLALTGSPNAQEKIRIQAGVLSCTGDGGWGAIITSKKQFDCVYSKVTGTPVGRYRAVVRKFGLDLGVTGKTTLQWAVFGPARRVGGRYVEGSLEGEYAGVGAGVAVGAGLGANALIGGGIDSFALQPVSIQVESGISIAAGIQTLVLTYVGPAL